MDILSMQGRKEFLYVAFVFVFLRVVSQSIKGGQFERARRLSMQDDMTWNSILFGFSILYMISHLAGSPHGPSLSLWSFFS
jgi:hypothetical protein